MVISVLHSRDKQWDEYPVINGKQIVYSKSFKCHQSLRKCMSVGLVTLKAVWLFNVTFAST